MLSVRKYMDLENADLSMLLICLIPQKLLNITPLFGFSFLGEYGGVRMHPLFPLRLLENVGWDLVDDERGMVRVEHHPQIRELFSSMCEDMDSPENWFPSPPPIRVYCEDIKCLRLYAHGGWDHENLGISLKFLLFHALDFLRSRLRPRLDVYVRCCVRGDSVSMILSIFMTSKDCERMCVDFVDFVLKKRRNYTAWEKPFRTSSDMECREISVHDCKMDLHTGDILMESDAYTVPADMRDPSMASHLKAANVKPSDMAMYLCFMQLEPVSDSRRRSCFSPVYKDRDLETVKDKDNNAQQIVQQV